MDIASLKNKPIDVHTHVFPDALAKKAMDVLLSETPEVRNYSDGTHAGLIAQMDEAGVGRAVAAKVATKPSQMEAIFRFSAELKDDPRLIPFPSIFPTAPDTTQWIDRAVKEGFIGIKIHPQYQGCPADDPHTIELVKVARDAGLVILIHAGDDFAFPGDKRASPARLAYLLDQVGEVKIIAAHMGGWMVWDEVLELLAGREHLYFDTSMVFSYSTKETMLELIEKHGVDRVMFGTDSPWDDISRERQRIDSLGLSKEDTEKILWENAQKVFGV